MIAVFYTDSIAWDAAAWALALLAVIVVANRAGLRSVDVYVALAVVFWVAVLKSGVHATLAGVVLAALTPARPYYGDESFEPNARELRARLNGEGGSGADGSSRQDTLLQFERLSRESVSPLDRLEHLLHPWVSYLIVPLFALANAGIALSGSAIRDAVSSDVTLGVVAGLVIGKPLGIVVMSWLALRLGWAQLPENVGLGHILGAGLLAGIGFTVSLFIAGLAFDDAKLIADAKLGILAASLLAGICGYVYLWIAPGEPD